MPNRRFVSAASGAFRKAISARASSRAASCAPIADREGRDRLEGRRDEADDVDPRLVQELAELLDADLRLAAARPAPRPERRAWPGRSAARRRRDRAPASSRLRGGEFRSGRSNSRSSGRRVSAALTASASPMSGFGAPALTASAIGERTKPGRRSGDRKPSASSLAITSAASTTRSNGSPARTRFAASTPPTASIAAGSPSSWPRSAAPARPSTRRVAIEEMPVIGRAMTSSRPKRPRRSPAIAQGARPCPDPLAEAAVLRS